LNGQRAGRIEPGEADGQSNPNGGREGRGSNHRSGAFGLGFSAHSIAAAAPAFSGVAPCRAGFASGGKALKGLVTNPFCAN
jgi:hypothetical protein